VEWVRPVTLLVCLVGWGCVGPSQEHFARIQPGSTTRKEVLQLLGPPTISEPGTFIYLGSDGRQAVVCFDQRQVVTDTQWWPPPRPVGEQAERSETTPAPGG